MVHMAQCRTNTYYYAIKKVKDNHEVYVKREIDIMLSIDHVCHLLVVPLVEWLKFPLQKNILKLYDTVAHNNHRCELPHFFTVYSSKFSLNL